MPLQNIVIHFSLRAVSNVVEVPYPHEFLASKNRKFIHVLSTGAFLRTDDGEVVPLDYLTFHATFVQDTLVDNYIVCHANERLVIPHVYELYSNQRSYKMWFEDPLALREDKKVDVSAVNVTCIVQLAYEF